MARSLDAYQQLEHRFRRIGAIGDALAMLHWDGATQMPAGSVEARGRHLAELEALAHDLTVAPEVADWIADAEAGEAGLDDWQRANLREIARIVRVDRAVPTALTARRADLAARTEMVWRQARPADDFARLVPLLEETVALAREEGEARAAVLGVSPYEALMDGFDPGRRTGEIDRLFDEVEAWLSPRLDRLVDAAPPAPPDGALAMTHADQVRLARSVMDALGFPFEAGRLDESAHPFSGGTPDDARVTLRVNPANVLDGLMAAIHETGHALYETGLPEPWRGQPVGEARGMAVHESQSLFYEMHVGRTDAFFDWLAELSKGRLSAGDMKADGRGVVRSLIRVAADEATYPLHVIFRYRLERALIEGRLAVRDLPEAWRAEIGRLLGVTPATDRDGVMQDIHWMEGLFGYFPTYLLGALTAAQVGAAVARDLGPLDGLVQARDFGAIRAWLRERIHGEGARLGADELMARATGEPLGTAAFFAHLTQRYEP